MMESRLVGGNLRRKLRRRAGGQTNQRWPSAAALPSNSGPYRDNRLTPVFDFLAPCKDAQWSPDGRWLVAWDEQAGLQVWDAVTGHSFQLKEPTDQAKTYSVAWSPDSQHLVAASGAAMLYL